jgi:putative hydrolase of the HAD superfamily
MPIKCITFDLDDTLWDCEPVIHAAETKFYGWLGERYPRITRRYDIEALVDHRREHFSRYPDMGHDFTWLRKRWLEYIARESGYDDGLVETGFRVFWEARNDVELFEHVEETLAELASRYRVGAITNGNADVHHIGIGHYFDFVVTAAGAGSSKPHPEIFEAALGEAGVSATQAIHVGDDPVRDVMGAKAVGMYAVWVNLTQEPWSGDLAPDAEVHNIRELRQALLDFEP